jgi:SAM-dependent methyltransferase
MPMVCSGACWICSGTKQEVIWTEPFDLSAHPRFGRYSHPDNPDSRLLRCQECGFAQPAELPGTDNYFDLLYADHPWLTSEALEQEYEAAYKDYIFRLELRGIHLHLGKGVPRTLIDVGTYTGRFLNLAEQQGWEAEGIELNTRAADFAERRTRRPVHRVKAQELSAHGRRFGAVVLTDVLEHIPFPRPLIASFRGLLHPGGVLAIKVPHGPAQLYKETVRAFLYRSPTARERHRVGLMTRFGHVNHFTVNSLRRCLEEAGFTRITVTVGPPEFVPARPGRTAAEAVSGFLRRVAYHTAMLIPKGTSSPLGFNLLAYGINPLS